VIPASSTLPATGKTGLVDNKYVDVLRNGTKTLGLDHRLEANKVSSLLILPLQVHVFSKRLSLSIVCTNLQYRNSTEDVEIGVRSRPLPLYIETTTKDRNRRKSGISGDLLLR
jgi:hypothetical protein